MPLFRTLLVDDGEMVRKVLEIRPARHDRLRIVGSVAHAEAPELAAASLGPA